jgi:hypothetical protein
MGVGSRSEEIDAYLGMLQLFAQLAELELDLADGLLRVQCAGAQELEFRVGRSEVRVGEDELGFECVYRGEKRGVCRFEVGYPSCTSVELVLRAESRAGSV